jgi:hypothetical protein
MSYTYCKLLAGLLVASLFAGPVAASTSLVSVSDSLAGSVEGMSSSVKHSSTSVQLDVAGDYKVLDVARAPDASGRIRLTLQPVVASDDKEEIYLYMQNQQYDRIRPQAGDIVSAKTRPYGAAFYMLGSADPFVLVFRDGWSEQMKAQPVTL